VGQVLTAEIFNGVTHVDVVGTSKGRGTAGVMKRHNFSGQKASHGAKKVHRLPGSMSANATNRGWSGRIKKGKRMAGRYGHARRTTRNLQLVRIDAQNNVLLVKGAVPGPNGGYVIVRRTNKQG
jgi:large subunit ribosomal protein L3